MILVSEVGHGKIIEKALPSGRVPGIVPFGGPQGTVTEPFFEKKDLIPEIQGILIETESHFLP